MDALEGNELTILGALAETLIPADDTPGADPEWAKSFVLRYVHAHPEEQARFVALARHLDAIATTQHGKEFALLTVPAREALLVAHHPSLADAAELTSEERTLRRTMKDMIAGFLSADGLDIHDDPFHLRPDAPRRDRELPSGIDFSRADSVPDIVVNRQIATWLGTGTYRRVWLAAGYACPPGQPPEHPEDVGRAPDELVALRSSKAKP